jgi:hypothetical protein
MTHRVLRVLGSLLGGPFSISEVREQPQRLGGYERSEPGIVVVLANRSNRQVKYAYDKSLEDLAIELEKLI